jgi:ubiquinone/menaquinone biosynthesis C-methylase UbiE
MMNERRFHREIERLRDPDRIARLEIERVADLALQGLPDARAVLDVGTGSGVFAEQFAARGLQVSGIDVNPDMLPAASLYVPSGSFKEAAAESLPYPDRSFDLVFMGLLLHETDDLLQALREANRVGARLAVLEWPAEEQSFGPPLAHRLTPEKITQTAHQAGFTEIHTTRLEHLVLYTAE